MCDRYALPDQTAAEREFMPSRAWWKFSERYNLAPQQYVPAIRIHTGEAEGLMMRWGLIPSWAEGKPAAHPPFQVPAAELQSSRHFRMPWLGSQRCIVPVAGFYVWQLTDEGYRQPYFVHLLNRSVFGLAAVWDRSEGGDDEVLESFAIITVPGNELLRGLAPAVSRMPAILKRRDYLTWLKGTPVQAGLALNAYDSRWMEAYPVSPRVNSMASDDSGLIRPL